MTPDTRRGSSPPRGPAGPREAVVLQEFKRAIATQSFVSEPVMDLCERLGLELREEVGTRHRENSLTQVRKFFNLARVLEQQSQQGDFATLRPRLRVLQAQVAYAVARENLGPNFKTLFDAVTDKVLRATDGKQAWQEFMTFFEALYAYFYFHSNRKKEGA